MNCSLAQMLGLKSSRWVRVQVWIHNNIEEHSVCGHTVKSRGTEPCSFYFSCRQGAAQSWCSPQNKEAERGGFVNKWLSVLCFQLLQLHPLYQLSLPAQDWNLQVNNKICRASRCWMLQGWIHSAGWPAALKHSFYHPASRSRSCCTACTCGDLKALMLRTSFFSWEHGDSCNGCAECVVLRGIALKGNECLWAPGHVWHVLV